MRISDWSSDVCSSDLTFLAVVAGRLEGDAYAVEDRYPLQALALLHQGGVDLSEERMITHDVVGNLLTAMDYQSRVVYVDDRFDMYPEPLMRSEENTSELQSLMRISYAVFCLKKKKKQD